MHALATTNTGIDVTGTITVGDGHTIGDDGNDNLQITASTNENVVTEGNGFIAKQNGTQGIRLDTNNDISFYEDTGSDVKFFWDASVERLGIKTTSPDDTLDINGFTKATRQRYLARGSFSNTTVTPVSAGNEFSYLINTFTFTGANTATGPGMYLVGRKGTGNYVKTIVNDTSVTVSINGSDQIEISSSNFTNYNIQIMTATY